jgi:hypothetical protein
MMALPVMMAVFVVVVLHPSTEGFPSPHAAVPNLPNAVVGPEKKTIFEE